MSTSETEQEMADNEELNEQLGSGLPMGRRKAAPKSNKSDDYAEEGPPTEAKAHRGDLLNHAGYIQWSTADDRIFVPVSQTRSALPPAYYEVKHSNMVGTYFEKIPVLSEGLLRFPDSKSDKVLKEIEKFWDRENLFRQYGIAYKRGIILYGPPGGGKSCTIQLVCGDVIARKGVVVKWTNPTLLAGGLRILREIQPDIPIVILMEDMDSIVDDHSESEVLNMLDGVDRVDKVVFLACHTPDTRLLTADLRWVPAGEIRVGDELWSLDEHRLDPTTVTGRETARRYRRAKVISSFAAQKECVRVHLDTGESFVCSADHPWLSKGAVGRGGRNLEWTQASQLLERPDLVRPFIPWEPDRSWEAGWFAGMLDGEGFIRKGRGGRTGSIGLVQVEGPTAARAVEVAAKFGTFESDRCDPGNGHQKQVRLRSTGGAAGAVSVIGCVRAKRLIENFTLEGGIVQCRFPARVVAVEPVGVVEIQSIETTTRTYFAEGFAVHNTTNYPERLGARIINRPSRFDKRIKIGNPSEAARRMYLEHLFSKNGAKADDMDKWVGDTDKLSLAHLKELFVAVTIIGDNYDTALSTLKSMRENISSDHDDDGPVGFGAGH